MEDYSGTRLYVGNLLYTAQPRDIEEMFHDNGFSITNLDMSIDPFSGRNPSYCFVDFATPGEASRAMSLLNGLKLSGRAVKIKPGVPKKPIGEVPKPRIKSYGAAGHLEKWSSGHLDDGIFEKITTSQLLFVLMLLKAEIASSDSNSYRPTFDRWTREDAADHWQKPLSKGTRLWVGGLPRIEPQSATDFEMQKLFEGFKLAAISKIVSPRPPEKSGAGNQYYLFVDMATPEDADAAARTLNGIDSPWGGRLNVAPARGNEDRKVMREQFGVQRGKEREINGPWRRRD
ncbi:MAG: hypothetical protein Q9227_002525 [Pyrenula ochraceoflavens]